MTSFMYQINAYCMYIKSWLYYLCLHYIAIIKVRFYWIDRQNPVLLCGSRGVTEQ